MEDTMSVIRKLLRFVDLLSEKAGAIGKWFAFLLVLIGTYETISRHFFNAPTIWAYDSLCMAGGTVYLLGASFDYLHDAHTRVDLIYSQFSERGRALINVICSVLFFFPLMTVMLVIATQWAIKAWRIHEVMFNSFWYPPAGPYRTVFALGLFLLVLQGLANLIRDVYMLIRGESID
jgi:TRAP-type mannitol/chloroaromatic compound transport system permease small subunit